jgi:methyltransferase-like protein
MPTTARILALQKQFFNQYKANKESWVKKYGADAEKVMTGTAFKRAESVAIKNDKQRIKEMIKTALMGPTNSGEINSKEFIQSREKNPKDVISVDVPLMLRLLEYAKEDAQTDMDLHKVTENLIELSKNGRILDMEDYFTIINPDNEKLS